ncbi:hypothetical protein IFO70_32495 [Phormidium tenue FACHB-886]|nr:hypothetical protein [Phormidium tenue FACHB-886]
MNLASPEPFHPLQIEGLKDIPRLKRGALRITARERRNKLLLVHHSSIEVCQGDRLPDKKGGKLLRNARLARGSYKPLATIVSLEIVRGVRASMYHENETFI